MPDHCERVADYLTLAEWAKDRGVPMWWARDRYDRGLLGCDRLRLRGYRCIRSSDLGEADRRLAALRMKG